MLLVAWVYRQVFACCFRVKNILFRPDDPKPDIVPVSQLPWMWLGAMYADCNVVDYTSVVNESVQYGVQIDPQWLEQTTNARDVTWLYLDPISLDQKEFPSEGFVIHNKDDTFSDDSEDEGHSSDTDPDHTE